MTTQARKTLFISTAIVLAALPLAVAYGQASAQTQKVEPRQPVFVDQSQSYKPVPKTLYLVPVDVSEAKVYDRNGSFIGVAKDTLLGPSHLPKSIVVQAAEGSSFVQKIGEDVELVLPYDTVDVRTGNTTTVTTRLSAEEAIKTAAVNERDMIEGTGTEDHHIADKGGQGELASLPDANIR